MVKQMEKKFDHKKHEKSLYEMWDKGGYFSPTEEQLESIDRDEAEPFSIILPPPNASGKMHTGNVLMIAIEDLLIRWHRMKGDPTLWLPGTDHAGFETQITYERELKKEGKSRFDYDREELYKKIWEFVEQNRGEIEQQIKDMGASVDWDRYTFTLDEEVVETVHNTFMKMYEEGLVYRDMYMVNYCPKCGTTFADLEVKHDERMSNLYYVKYAVVDSEEEITVATTRPETIILDTHIAVSPKDEAKQKWVGKMVINPMSGKEMEIISDEIVDPEFGTGFVKLTPAHDKNDYEAGIRHDLPMIVGIDLNGRMTSEAGPLEGLTVMQARAEAEELLSDSIEKIDETYENSAAVCYKGRHDIEPMVMPNWFVKVDPLKGPAKSVVESGKVKIYPKWREKTYIKWMEEMRDWPISRQVVWGIRIPAWYKVSDNQKLVVSFLSKSDEVVVGEIGELMKEHDLAEVKDGLQTLIAPKGAKYTISTESPGDDYLQETDTFDTWFSSGQWPLVTLGYPDSDDFRRFYPTSVLETGWEIIRFWVSRMIMFGIYLTGEAPFHDVYLHGLVRARDGKKMSKSLGNVIDPEKYMEDFGVDALRMGLISGTANGKDFKFPHDKVVAYRNFSNKIWNMVRFMNIMFEKYGKEVPFYTESMGGLQKEDEEIINKYKEAVEAVDGSLGKFRFAEAGETIYHFMWDDVASTYIEQVKDREDKNVALSVLRYVLSGGIKLLHPFMPYVTEAVWGYIPKESDTPLIVSKYPTP